jgi:hypothetical protein
VRTARYRVVAVVDGTQIDSPEVVVRTPAAPGPQLVKAHPNPFNPFTRITYSVPSSQRIVLTVYDLSGRLVRRLVDATSSAGEHSVTWDGYDESGGRVASGVYSIQLQAGASTRTKRVVLLK